MGCGLDSFGSRHGPMAGSSEHSNELSKAESFSTNQATVICSKTLLHGVR